MNLEGQHQDKKSLRTVIGKTADWYELAKDCVAFANASGGRILLGVEDTDELPPAVQRIEEKLSDMLKRRISELTVNVSIVPVIETASNGAEFIVLTNAHIQQHQPVMDAIFYVWQTALAPWSVMRLCD